MFARDFEVARLTACNRRGLGRRESDGSEPHAWETSQDEVYHELHRVGRAQVADIRGGGGGRTPERSATLWSGGEPG